MNEWVAMLWDTLVFSAMVLMLVAIWSGTLLILTALYHMWHETTVLRKRGE